MTARLLCSCLCNLSSSVWYLPASRSQCCRPYRLPVCTLTTTSCHLLPLTATPAGKTARLSQHWATSKRLRRSKGLPWDVKVNSHVGKHLYLASVTLQHHHLVASLWQVDRATWIFTADAGAWREGKSTEPLSQQRLSPTAALKAHCPKKSA